MVLNKQHLLRTIHKSNGQAENSVKYSKNKLQCIFFRDNVNLSIALPTLLFHYRNSVHSTTNETPAKPMSMEQCEMSREEILGCDQVLQSSQHQVG